MMARPSMTSSSSLEPLTTGTRADETVKSVGNYRQNFAA